jgi:Glycosyltransferases involved in cell wall biogenesis
VIVIDGGSSDYGLTIVEDFTNIDSRIRLIAQEDKGVSEARNQGIRESKSELISFLDADDEWMPNYLETILRLREKYPDAGLYATSLKTEVTENVLMDMDEELRDLVPNEGLLLNYFKAVLKKDVSKIDLFSTSSVTVPKKVFSEIGGFQAGFWWG